MGSDHNGDKENAFKLLSALEMPYFDFLVFAKGECWEKPGTLKTECYHHSDSLLIHESTVIVYLDAFWKSHPKFNGYGPNEYKDENLADLRQRLVLRLLAVESCSDAHQFLSLLTVSTTSDYDRLIGNWQSKWQIIRDELIEQGQQILDRAEQAQREQKSLLVLGI